MGYQFHWDADTYLELVRAEVSDYDRLQEETAAATQSVEAHAILELGTGTGRPRAACWRSTPWPL